MITKTGEGAARYDQANILYNYLIDSAIKNADKYTSNGYKKPVEMNLTELTSNADGKYEIDSNRNGDNYITGPIKITKNNDLNYDIKLKITNSVTGAEINSSNYTFTDANGTALGTTDITTLAGRTDGFYISIPRTVAKEIDIDVTINYNTKIKKIWLVGTENENTSVTLDSEQPVLEVSEEPQTDSVKLTAIPKEFDLALRKYITKLNGTDIADTRVPNISEDTLQNGTTATYRHRKDPLVVENGDIVTYKITIYNEGNKNGYASAITDQLPTGLKYTGETTITSNKNTYNVTYDSKNNKITFTTTTATALNAYEVGKFDNETLEFTCEVTATPDTSSDKILTNVAWISKAYDLDANKEITNIGDDRDSRPQTYPTLDKDSMENYKGNSSNKTDLTDSTYYYAGEQDDDDFEKLVVEPQTSITVTKTWDDNNDQDGLRKKITSVSVNLLANNQVVDTANLTPNNSWTYTFSNLPVKENGNVITYSVAEASEIAGYETTVNGFTITNTHTPEITQVSVEKIWNDNNNQDGKRSSSISVSLLADGTAVNGKTITLNDANSWKYTFTDLPVYSNGNKITYTVSEPTLPTGYTKEITGDATTGFIITNTHKIFDLALRKYITKVNDTALTTANTRVPNISEDTLQNVTTATYKHRKDPVQVVQGDVVTYQIAIYNEGQKTGYASQIIDQLPTGLKYSGDATIISKNASGANKNTYNVNYDSETNKITLDITGVAKDLNAYQEGKLDKEIIEIKCTVVAEADTTSKKTLTNVAWISGAYDTENNTSTTTDRDSQPETTPNVNKDNMEKYKGNTENNEDLTDKTYYYKGEQDDDDFEKLVIEPESTNVSVKKVWEDNNNQDGIRPKNITITLFADGEEVEGKKVQIKGDENEWTYTYENLPKYANGVEITYTINETGVPQGYDSSKTGDMANGFTITNTHTPEVRDISVKKVWVDSDNQDGIRPTSIELILKANGTEKQRHTLEGNGNEWTYTFTNLPKYENGTEITYTVEESGVPSGYKSLTTGSMVGGFTLTNTYTPGKTSVKVKKVWEDNNNQDGLRPDKVSVSLIANGDETNPVQTVDLNEANGWEYTFTDLPEKSNGNEIEYSIIENTKIDGYTTSIKNNNTTSTAGEIQTTSAPEYTITNTHDTDEISITVNKVWNDDNDADKIRPTSIVVNVKNGEQIVATITLSAENNWTHTFENLPAKQNGNNINYVLEEVEPDGYTGNITENSANNYTITNTHTPNKAFDLALRKYITKINNNDLTTLGLASRIPKISEAALKTGTTAEYQHRKDPIKVEEGDIVTYQITVYNEGDKDGYANQIIDQLPTGLIYNPSSTVTSKDSKGADKNTYTVTYEASTNRVTFDIVNTEGNSAKDLKAYAAGNLDSETIEIKCKVVYKAVVGNKNILTNVAWINEAYNTTDKKSVIKAGEDRDSEPGTKPNVNKDNMENYKGDTSNKDDLADSTYYYKGEQDDDDFEKIYVKTFDLSLRKFIISVNGVEMKDNKGKYTREPDVDITGLKNGTSTTAIYKHPKTPVSLKVGDNVIYTIRVYNEGEVAGYANEVKDYLPPYLIYVEDSAINKKYGWQISENGRIATTSYLSNKEISEFDGTKLAYEDLQIECKISENAIPDESITNIAEISEYKYGDTVITQDIDSKSDNITEKLPEDEKLPDYKKDKEKDEYIPGNEDDDDFEKVYVKEFDLALRKFITKVQEKEVTTREPQVKNEDGKISYEHTKDPVTLHVGDVVIYTLRIYNEGEIDGYASEITDDIPEFLEYLPDETTNVEYMWKMYDENGKETTNVQQASKVKTTYLSKDNSKDNLLKAFDGNTLYYKDIKIAFKVKDPNSNTYIITNHAQISDDTDEDGNKINDKDSETDKWNEGEDDQDIENVKVEYFDLSILKFVSKVIIQENGQEKITQTGYNGHEDPEPVVKVELHKKKLDNVVVKFGYGITVTNEGDIPGYATELKDYVPEGLKFEAIDNPNWTDEGDNVISTKQLEKKLLQPGESATVEVVLTWINGAENLALKTNIVEISDDSNEYDVPDRDSTPDNKKDGEDDIDIAKVILAISTGTAKTYFTLTIGLLAVAGIGIVLIKKYVL